MVDYKCSQCSKKFANNRYLTKHVIRMHKNKKDTESSNQLTCSICNKNFPRLSHLQRHQLTHLGLREWSCLFCNEKFIQKAHTLRHIARKHPYEDSNDLEQRLEAIKNGYSDNNGYKNQASSSKDKVPCSKLVRIFPCVNCGVAFYNSYDLNKHSGSVHKIIQCDKCQTTIEGEKAFKEHVLKCRNEAYGCEICSSSFSSKNLLKNHENACCKKGSFMCIACQEVFTQRTQLDRHLKKEHCGGTWRCKLCDQTLKSASEIRIHIKSEHSKDVCSYCQTEQDDVAKHISETHWKKLQVPRAINRGKARDQQLNRHKNGDVEKRDCDLVDSENNAMETEEFDVDGNGECVVNAHLLVKISTAKACLRTSSSCLSSQNPKHLGNADSKSDSFFISLSGHLPEDITANFPQLDEIELEIIGGLPEDGYLSFILPIEVPNSFRQQAIQLLRQPINI